MRKARSTSLKTLNKIFDRAIVLIYFNHSINELPKFDERRGSMPELEVPNGANVEQGSLIEGFAGLSLLSPYW